MMSDIKVSVIVPSLNVQDYIEECIMSALSQTLAEIEIICIDAGSTDGTWEKLLKLSKEDSRIELIHSDIKSYGYQVNLGVEHANGQYVAILESDDYVAPEIYEKLYRAAEENHSDYAKCGYYTYCTMNNGERFFLPKKTLNESELYGKVLDVKSYPSLAMEDWYLWNGIYKKSFIYENRIRLTESKGAAFQDIGFLTQVCIKAGTAVYLKEPLYMYCIDREDSSSNIGKSLEYACNEFKVTIEKLNNRNELETFTAKRALYLRMVKSFVCCYGESAGSSIQEDKRLQYYNWFRDELKRGIDEEMIKEEWIPVAMWNTLEKLLESEDAYTEKISQMDRELENALGDVEKSSVVIFGCGTFGFRAYKWLSKRNYMIKAFMDNNGDLWGRKIYGIPIMCPDEMKRLPEGFKFLVANEACVDEIYSQIASMGVKDVNIVKFR